MSVIPIKKSKSKFGQLVIGPPGSGKTTYCAELNTFLNNKLNRKSVVINLDPANDNMGYKTSINIMELITVEDVMNNLDLGPNGALMFCVEYMEKNMDWLLDKLKMFSDTYLIFDLPGQVELYTHHNSIKNIFDTLNKLDYNLCTIHLIDSHYCSEPTKFISTLLLSLSTMLQIGLPHVNVLSKADQLVAHSDKLHFGLDFYTEVLNLDYLLELLDTDAFSSKFKKLNSALTGLVQDYGLVCFFLLDVHKEKDLINIKNAADKANGFVYGSREERSIQSLLSCAVGARTQTEEYDAEAM